MLSNLRCEINNTSHVTTPYMVLFQSLRQDKKSQDYGWRDLLKIHMFLIIYIIGLLTLKSCVKN